MEQPKMLEMLLIRQRPETVKERQIFENVDVLLVLPLKGQHRAPLPSETWVRKGEITIFACGKADSYHRASMVHAPEQPPQVLHLLARLHAKEHLAQRFRGRTACTRLR